MHAILNAEIHALQPVKLVVLEAAEIVVAKAVEAGVNITVPWLVRQLAIPLVTVLVGILAQVLVMGPVVIQASNL